MVWWDTSPFEKGNEMFDKIARRLDSAVRRHLVFFLTELELIGLRLCGTLEMAADRVSAAHLVRQKSQDDRSRYRNELWVSLLGTRQKIADRFAVMDRLTLTSQVVHGESTHVTFRTDRPFLFSHIEFQRPEDVVILAVAHNHERLVSHVPAQLLKMPEGWLELGHELQVTFVWRSPRGSA